MSAPESLNLAQRLTLVRFWTDYLASRRTGVMVPESREEWESGARVPAKFGGRLAAWVSLPQPTQKSAYVKDPGKLLAWAKTNYPGKVQPTTEVEVTPGLIAHLKEHFPSALKTGEEVDPQWVSDILAALKEPGHYDTINWERLFPDTVPGIVLPEPVPPVPHVDLVPDAEAVIGEAWRSGDIPMGELLALPAPDPESETAA